eukprot:1301956-Prymnesium_polylepis.2
MVTHGHTFCTTITFEEVAKAIGEFAFVNHELPVVLSLEMHCGPKQQQKLAKHLADNTGQALLRVTRARCSGCSETAQDVCRFLAMLTPPSATVPSV